MDPRHLSPQMRERYGVRPTPVWVKAAMGVTALALFVGLGVLVFSRPTPDFRVQATAFRTVSDERTDIDLQAWKKPEDTLYCVVRAQSRDRIDLGYATVTIPAGKDFEALTYPIHTLAASFTAELLGCGANQRPQVAKPDFAPGTSNPSQPWQPPRSSD